MKNRWDRVADGIRSFVQNPITNLVKGIALLVIGLSEASRTFSEDMAHHQLRVGHGLVIIGFFAILEALPHLIEGLEASQRFLDVRAKKARPEPGAETGPRPGDDELR
jgi:hypothetical protein